MTDKAGYPQAAFGGDTSAEACERMAEQMSGSVDNFPICIFCGRDPYEYVDVGVGMQRVAVSCCEMGIGLYHHRDEQLSSLSDRMYQGAALIRQLVCERDEARALSMPAPARAWRVKLLEWEDPSERNNWVHVAKSSFGEYYVSIDGGSHTAWLEAHVKPYEKLLGPAVGSVYEAKDQAQADYAARILAALTPDTEGV